MCQRWSCTSHKPGRRTVMATCRTRNFGDWDVLPHYETGGTVGVDWISYTETDQTSASGWTLTNFRLLNGRSEVFGASELGPGEAHGDRRVAVGRGSFRAKQIDDGYRRRRSCGDPVRRDQDVRLLHLSLLTPDLPTSSSATGRSISRQTR